MTEAELPNLRETFWVEQRRSRIRILLLVIPLAVFHIIFFSMVLGILLACLGNFALLEYLFSREGLKVLYGVGFVLAVGHYFFARAVVMDRLHAAIGAQTPDPFDSFHRRLMNIVDEVSIAAGIPSPELHIVPSLALNAFALDAAGKQRVYVTEGALSLLDRDELQAVVAHVLAHLSAGDVKIGTLMIAVSNAIAFVFNTSGSKNLRVFSNEPRGFLALLVLNIYAFIAATVASILCSIVSRKRKLLADQLAVEITRHPEALAAALYRMEIIRRTRLPVACDELGIVCIVPPLYRVLDESSGLFASVFSVHPPVLERIARLSRYPLDVLETRLRPPEVPITRASVNPISRYFIYHDNAWYGPYPFAALSAWEGLTPETWVSEEGSHEVNLMARAPWFQKWVAERRASAGLIKSPRRCACCGGDLTYDYVEGARIERCSGCGGVMLDRTKIQKIQVRHEKRPSTEPLPAPLPEPPGRADFMCPRCQITMIRKFFSIGKQIVIDECPRCRLVYLDPGELELLRKKDT